MGKEQIISKGKYTLSQPENMVGVKQYLFVRDEDGKKRLLLRFANNRGEKCSKFAFILYRLDAKGNVLGQDKYESADTEFEGNEVFSFDRRIAVEEKCSNFRVQMVYARYGNYTYNVEHENVSVAYSEKNTTTLDNAKSITKVKPRKINARGFDMPWLFIILAILMLSFVVLACGFLLNDFMEREIDFTLSGVDYRFTDKNKKDDVIIMGCADTYPELTLRGDVEGHRVVGIDEDAFEGNKKLEKLTIDGLNIPDRTFENCKNLEVVTIKNVTEIGARAFADCVSLETVTITEGKAGQVITLGKRAFANCRGLRTVEINQTLSYGEDADYFYGATGVETLKLRNFAYTAKNLETEYVTRLAALFGEENKEKPTLKLVYLTIEKMDAIPEAFAYGLKNLKSVTVSGTEIKTVGDNAFSDCSSLNKLSFKGKLTTIGDYAFSNTNIETLDMSKVSSLGQGVFKNNDKLTSVTALGAGGIDNIPKNTFEGCISLKSFTFHKNIKHIFTEAFKGSGLTKISIPAGVSYDAGILKDCRKLEELEVYEFGAAGYVGQLFGATRGDDVTSEAMAAFIPNTLTTVTLGSGTEINESAFKGCKNVTTINLPGDIVTIGDNAFSGCKKLAVVDIPADSITLKTIGDKAFYKCEKLKYVPLLESLERIGVSALEGCNSLESITLPFLGATPYVDENETVSYVFGGTIPASIKEIALFDALVVDLPEGAFKGCVGVKKITIPNNIASIGASSFEGCRALTTVALSDGTSPDLGADMTNVVNIGARAFLECESLSTVEFSDSIGIISANAFARTGLLKMSIPTSVEYIGEDILAECSKIGTVELPYLGSNKTANGSIGYFFAGDVPSSLKAVTVLYFHDDVIGTEAFYNCSNVTSFNLPRNIVAISEAAFKGCSSLNGFSFGEIKTIGDSAFYGCTSLKDIDLSRVEIVGNDAFYACEGITKVTLTNAMIIGFEAFEKCTSLATVTLGENTLEIGNSAFYETAIKSIAVPEGVDTLNDYTFGKCASLTSVQLPSTLTHIGDGVFRDTAITSISIPDGVTYIGGFAFKNTGLTSLKIPAGTTYIGINVIEDCTSLESLEFPMTSSMDYQNVQSYFANYTFPDTLKKITVNNSANNYIHSEAFAYCDGVEEIIINADIVDIYSSVFYDCSELRYVSLPRTLEYVDYSAFSECYHLYEISNPSGVAIDCEYVISYTPSLQERAQTVERDGYKYALYNGEWYLINYPSAEDVTANGIAGMVNEYKIPSYLFCGDNSITSVTLNGTPTSIGVSAFERCHSLERVTLASSVEHIGNDAFYDCYELTEVSMPSSLKTIGDRAFYSCGKLNNVKLYSKVSSIGEDAFFGCSNLFDVYNSSALNLVAGSKSYGYVARRAVKVHTDMSEASSVEVSVEGIGTFRRSGSAWLLISGTEQSIITLGDFTFDGVNVTSYRIGEGAFQYNYSLENLTIGNAVKQIQEKAFYDCDSLKTVNCSSNSSLTEIEASAFADCNYLEEVKLPSSVKIIGDYCFYDCARIESVQMPTALETIGEYAFYNCERLISITIHENVREIKQEAFSGCDYLLEVYDLSPFVVITKGYSSNGCVAQNADAVYTSEIYALERREQNGIKFIKGQSNWYIYDFTDAGQTVLEIPNFGSSLIIMPYSIVNGSFEGVVMPTNVTYIAYDGIVSCNSFESIYYMSSSSYDWESVEGYRQFSGFQTVYYKEDCVHYYSYRVWTRDDNGNVTTQVCPETESITKVATCYENGEITYTCACSGCTYSRRESIYRLNHDIDANNVCRNCGETLTQISGTNIQSYIDAGVIEIDGFEYSENKGMFLSTNKDFDSMGMFAIKANQRMTLSFDIEASCFMDIDYVRVYKNGVKGVEISGIENTNVHYLLEEGDIILITYEKKYMSSYRDDCGYIKNLQIIEMKEPASN